MGCYVWLNTPIALLMPCEWVKHFGQNPLMFLTNQRLHIIIQICQSENPQFYLLTMTLCTASSPIVFFRVLQRTQGSSTEPRCIDRYGGEGERERFDFKDLDNVIMEKWQVQNLQGRLADLRPGAELTLQFKSKGLWLLGWGPATLWKAICCTQSTPI